jgi:hypothetical protein
MAHVAASERSEAIRMGDDLFIAAIVGAVIVGR